MTSMMSYTAPPTIAGFMQSEAFVRVILGPVGSGKSTGCLMEIVRRMTEQKPGPDGVRRTRFAVVRQTLSQIKQTILKEFFTWIGPITNFKVSDSTIYINFNDVESEIHLIPLDDEQDIRRLLSMQLTGVWINEFPEIDSAIIPSVCGRLGRYPSAAQGGPSWFGLIMDGNFPNEGGPWWELLEPNLPADWDLWKQPGGREGNAENVENLPGGREYYNRLARGQSDIWVQRYVDAKYGPDPSGMAVFSTSFKDSFHCVETLEPVQGHPVLIGQDFGRDPWSVICQLDHKGRLLILEEVEAEDIGLEQHIQRSLRPKLMQERYLGKKVAIIGDPAGRSKDSIYEETSFDVLKRAGFQCFPAPTNDIDARLRSVEAMLLSQRDGGPAMVFDKSRCPTLVRAMSGGYRYGKTRQGQRKPSPDKNEYSHVADALQYVCLGAHGGMVTGMVMRHLSRDTKVREPMSAAGWT